MYQSLCGSDFYPLIIHNHTRWMSYEEKVAYRTKHKIPRSIDEWIEGGKAYIKEPISLGTSHKYTLLQDIVECIFNIVCKEVSGSFIPS